MHRVPRSRRDEDRIARVDGLKLARSRSARPLPRGFTGHVDHPSRAIEIRSLPTSLAATQRGFAFYVAFPENSIPSVARVLSR